jgi:EmrB/QacA subfamily drug resistance transporter
MALGNAILISAFPSNERGKALGLLETVVGTGLMLGPALGGVLLDTLGWRAVFYLRIPVGVAACGLAWAALREQPARGPRGRLDLWGTLTLSVGLSAFILGINQGHRWGWGSAQVLALEAVAAATLAAFLFVERRVQQPVVDLSLFRSRPFAVANSLTALYALGTVSVSFLMPFYLISALGLAPSRAGLVLITVPLALLVLSPGSGWLSDKIGARRLITAGLGCQCLSLFLLSRLTLESSITHAVLVLSIGGVGSGLFWTPIYSFIMGAAPSGRLGTVSALIPTLRGIGHTTGLATAGAVFAAQRAAHLSRASPALAPAQAEAGAVVAGFQGAVLLMAAFALLGLILSFFGRVAPREQGAAPAHGAQRR